MMEKPPGLDDGEVRIISLMFALLTDRVLYQTSRANLVSSGPIVIDLLGDTPRPTSRLLQRKTKGDTGMRAMEEVPEDIGFCVSLHPAVILVPYLHYLPHLPISFP